MPRKYKGQVGYSAVNHGKSLYSVGDRCFMGMLGGIPPNTQRLSSILIGCIFYGVV